MFHKLQQFSWYRRIHTFFLKHPVDEIALFPVFPATYPTSHLPQKSSFKTKDKQNKSCHFWAIWDYLQWDIQHIPHLHDASCIEDYLKNEDHLKNKEDLNNFTDLKKWRQP